MHAVGQLGYLVTSMLFIFALHWMNTPATARNGVYAGVAATVIAIGVTWADPWSCHHGGIVLAIAAGFIVGVPLSIDRFRTLNLVYDGRLTVLGTGDFAVLLAHGNLVFKEPADGRAALRGAIGQDAVVASESFALKAGKHAGDTVRLQTPHGPADFRLAAVYFDYTTDRGVVVMDRGTFARHFGEQRPTSLTVYLRPGRDAAAVRADLIARLGERHRLFIHTNASIRDEVLRIFDSTFAITYALEAIAVFVGILGVSGTLLTLILERRRELTTLRLVGADRAAGPQDGRDRGRHDRPRQPGARIGRGLGLALILIYVINVQSFGWTIQFYLPGLVPAAVVGRAVRRDGARGAVSGAAGGRGAAGGASRRMSRARAWPALLAACSRAAAAAAGGHASRRGATRSPDASSDCRPITRSHPEYRIEWWYYTGNLAIDRRPPVRVPAHVLPHRRGSRCRRIRRGGPCATCSWRTSRSRTSPASGTSPPRSSVAPA